MEGTLEDSITQSGEAVTGTQLNTDTQQTQDTQNLSNDTQQTKQVTIHTQQTSKDSHTQVVTQDKQVRTNMNKLVEAKSKR